MTPVFVYNVDSCFNVVVPRAAMGLRWAGRCRYFEAGHGHAGAEGAGAGQEGGVGQEASKKRYPLVEQPYPDPRFETRDSLAVRAQLSATAFITLNEQVGLGVLLPA